MVEILITIALIGVLSAGIVSVIDPIGQIQKARDAIRKQDLSQIRNALETYYQDNGKYPEADTSVSTNYRIKRDPSTTVEWGNEWVPYMSILPKDPSSLSKNYIYYSDSGVGNQSYFLYASLDRGANDPQACNGGAECNNVPGGGVACGTGICNYGVASSNVSP